KASSAGPRAIRCDPRHTYAYPTSRDRTGFEILTYGAFPLSPLDGPVVRAPDDAATRGPFGPARGTPRDRPVAVGRPVPAVRRHARARQPRSRQAHLVVSVVRRRPRHPPELGVRCRDR